ncbi:PREDICTED: uncharacterized protein LOC104761259 [Camelina sativa]|uniref:Uncharacterized protein LOC104761259 n=1 Tax=Camelina sativa TaxID=90675 RepID=A0ABM1R9V4_CAMSA|nr:PREDICTED: uncharacterized protein LOC104761259 [Camelina sativa]
MVKVEDGLPSSVRDIDYMIGLYEHFSSCGEVTDVSVIPTVDLVDGKFVPTRLAEISIMGKGCVQKALELSGRNAQGWNLVVRHVAPPSVPKRQRTGCEHPSIVLAKMEKAEMEKAKKMGKGKKKKNAAE